MVIWKFCLVKGTASLLLREHNQIAELVVIVCSDALSINSLIKDCNTLNDGIMALK